MCTNKQNAPWVIKENLPGCWQRKLLQCSVPTLCWVYVSKTGCLHRTGSYGRWCHLYNNYMIDSCYPYWFPCLIPINQHSSINIIPRVICFIQLVSFAYSMAHVSMIAVGISQGAVVASKEDLSRRPFIRYFFQYSSQHEGHVESLRGTVSEVAFELCYALNIWFKVEKHFF